MNSVVSLSPQQNLTGQITIIDFIPVFTGNYSYVYRGTLNNAFVAVKVIRGTGDEDSVKRKLHRERVVWSSTDHHNIHPFYGFADDQAFGPFGALVSPWCPNGDASRFLSDNGMRMILAARIELWKGVIDGVAYLHAHRPTIVHGDLKPGNILIDEFGVPKICDFGLARIFLEAGSSGMTTTTEHTGTTRYLAPELVSSDDTVYPTPASDVYALGCLGLEFIYMQKPYANRVNNLRGQIIRDLRAGIPPATQCPPQPWPSHRSWPLLTEMWRLDPFLRPSALTAVQSLNRSNFSLPLSALRRVIEYVATPYTPMDHEISGYAWNQRTALLRHLTLVSRAAWSCANPVLYRNIRLYLNDSPSSLSKITYALEISRTKVLSINTAGSSGYGGYTRMLLVAVQPNQIDISLSSEIEWMINRMNGLTFILIRHAPAYWPLPIVKIHSLTTLEIQRLPISLLLDQEPLIRSLSCLERLCIREGLDRSGWSPSLPPSRINLLNLQDITIYGRDDTLHSAPIFELLDAFSSWTMPHFKFLHLTTPTPSSSPQISTLFKFLTVHGNNLQYFNCDMKNGPSLSDILPFCDGLRSIFIHVQSLTELNLRGLRPRLSLKTISLRWAFDLSANILDKEIISTIFKSRVDMLLLFPGLEIARITLGLSCPVSLSVRHEDDFVTCVEGRVTWVQALPLSFLA